MTKPSAALRFLVTFLLLVLMNMTLMETAFAVDATNVKIADDTYAYMNKELISDVSRKPMMTFIDDDARSTFITKWEPIIKEKDVPVTVAVITNFAETNKAGFMTWADMHRLDDAYHMEFVSHTNNHLDARTLTESQIEDEISTAKALLKREGFSHDIIVQPFGYNVETVRNVSRRYARANISTREGINTLPLDQFHVNRVTLAEGTHNTFADYKAQIDKAIAEKGWIIFKSHSHYETFDANQIAIIKQIIDYARQNGVEIVNASRGLDYHGNILDIGDYTARLQDKDYTIIDATGRLYSKSNSIDFHRLKYNSVSATSDVNAFPANSNTVLEITGGNESGFPGNQTGTLHTSNAMSPSMTYQLFYPTWNNDEYKRRWDKTNQKWLPWEKIGGPMTGSVPAPAPITEVPTTEKPTTETPLPAPAGPEEEMIRLSVPSATVPANSTVDVIVNKTYTQGLKVGDSITGNPEKLLPKGIMNDLIISQSNAVTVRLSNTTRSSIYVPATWYSTVVTVK